MRNKAESGKALRGKRTSNEALDKNCSRKEPRRERGLQAKGEGAAVVVLSEKGQRMRAEGPLQEPELLMHTVYEGEAGREAGEMGKTTKSGESKGAV